MCRRVLIDFIYRFTFTFIKPNVFLYVFLRLSAGTICNMESNTKVVTNKYHNRLFLYFDW